MLFYLSRTVSLQEQKKKKKKKKKPSGSKITIRQFDSKSASKFKSKF